jgi:glycine/D-amino acid oxidase-like deaminating enzyme
MDTKSGYPFWVIKNGLLANYPRLERDVRCDVLVIGGGITGALIADELSRSGHAVVVVEQRDLGWGSTAASTALLQYEIDAHMTELAERFDEPTAALAYSTCVTAVDELCALARNLRDVGFQRADSVYLASSVRDARRLDSEYAMRRRHGIPSRLLDAKHVDARYGVTAPRALFTRTAAVIDPYRFTCRLLERVHRRGAAIFDRTRIERIVAGPRGVQARTDSGAVVRAGHVVLAAGYETQRWLRTRVARNRSTFATISDPIDVELLRPFARTIVWESARPYHYLRTTDDHRVLVGGEDEPTDRPRQREQQVPAKARALQRYLHRLAPHLPFVPAYSWAGTFAETRDGLPFFGSHAQRGPRVLYAMAYGGNGITYSALGAGVLRAQIERRAHPLAELYSFRRSSKKGGARQS